MKQRMLRLSFLVLFISKASGWRFAKIAWSSPKTDADYVTASSADDGSSPQSALALPDVFYTGELVKGSNCYQAHAQLGEFCTLSSAIVRMRMATALTNCHLEAAGRKPIIWSPKSRLRDAPKADVGLVMRFVPLLRSVCDGAGRNPDFALFRMHANNDIRLGESIKILRDSILKAEAANADAERLSEKFESYTATALQHSKQALKLTGSVQDIVESFQGKLVKERKVSEEIRESVEKMTADNQDVTVSMLGVLRKATRQTDEKVKFHARHSELLHKYIKVQAELKRQGAELAMCPNRTYIGSVLVSKLRLPLNDVSLRKLAKSALTNALIGSMVMPFKLTTASLKAFVTEMLFNEKYLTVICLRLGITAVGLLVSYKVLSLVSRLANLGLLLLDNTVKILNMCLPSTSTPLLTFSRWMASKTETRSFTPTGGIEAEREELLFEAVARVNKLLEEKLCTSLPRNHAGNVQIAAEIVDRLANLEETFKHVLLTRINRVERRQIYIYDALGRSTRGRVGTTKPVRKSKQSRHAQPGLSHRVAVGVDADADTDADAFSPYQRESQDRHSSDEDSGSVCETSADASTALTRTRSAVSRGSESQRSSNLESSSASLQVARKRHQR